MVTLAEYLATENISQEAFGLRVGVKQATVSRLASGVQRPGLPLAVAIERATAGAVPASSWIPAEDPTPDTPHPEADAA